jgi:hypothetical protein
LGLASPAKFAGSAWLLVGVIVVGWRTQWYRKPLRLLDPSIYE